MGRISSWVGKGMIDKQATNVSVNVPSSGVTAVTTADGDQDVVVSQSDDFSHHNFDRRGMPMGWDTNSESLYGQTSGSPTNRVDAAAAIQQGNLSALENLDFGVAGDGAPVVGFIDESGNRQVIRVTAGEWMTRLSNRDLARREMQFQVNAEKKRNQTEMMFRQHINSGDFTEGDRRALKIAFRLDPDNALKISESTRKFNIEQDYKRKLVGGADELGQRYVDWAESNGYDMSGKMTPKQWRDFQSQVASNDEQSRIPVEVHGKNMPLAQASIHHQLYQSNVDQAKTTVGRLNKDYENGGIRFSTDNGHIHVRGATDRLVRYARGPVYMSLPEDATILSIPDMKNTSSDVIATLLAAAVMSGTFTGSMATAAGEGNDDPAIQAEQQKLLSAINQVSARLGWSPMTSDQLLQLQPHVSTAASNWNRNVEGVKMISPHQQDLNEQRRVAEEKSRVAEQAAKNKRDQTALNAEIEAAKEKREYDRLMGNGAGNTASSGSGSGGDDPSAKVWEGFVEDENRNNAANQIIADLIKKGGPFAGTQIDSGPNVTPVMQLMSIVDNVPEARLNYYSDHPAVAAAIAMRAEMDKAILSSN